MTADNSWWTAAVESVRQAATENLGIKAVALAASLILFAYVHGADDEKRILQVPIDAFSPGQSDMILASVVPERVRVTLKGNGARLRALRVEDLGTVQVELVPGRRYHYIEAEDFQVPPGLEIESIEPASFPLRWLEQAERELQIEPRIIDEPGGDFVIRSVRVEPTSLVARGARSQLDLMQNVRTVGVSVAGLSPGINPIATGLEMPPANVDFGEVENVQVIVEIAHRENEQEFRGLEVALLGDSRGISIRPSTVSVKVRGPREKVQHLEPALVIPWIDLEEVEVGTQPANVLVRDLPLGLTAVEISPPEVLVTVANNAPALRKREENDAGAQ